MPEDHRELPGERPIDSGAAFLSVSRWLLPRCPFSGSLQRRIQFILGQPSTVIRYAPPNEVKIEVILGVRQQSVPGGYRYQHGLRAPVRAEEHGLGVTGVEPLGDLAQFRPDLACRDYVISHDTYRT
jgi:hypothetical protein